MKKIPMILVVALTSLLMGCATNSSVGPALLRLGVSSTAGYSLMKNPSALPGVQAGASVVCAAAHGTNVSPASIVAALDAYGQRTPEAVFILNSAIGAYNIVYNGLSSTNATSASPYALALCDGLNDALAMVSVPPVPGGVNAPPRIVASPKAQSQYWPQIKFK